MSTESIVYELSRQNLIDVGEIHISRTSLGKKIGSRYLIYLPMNRNYLWRLLHEKGIKVRVFIEVPRKEVNDTIGVVRK
jgi:hypothetical protein